MVDRLDFPLNVIGVGPMGRTEFELMCRHRGLSAIGTMSRIRRIWALKRPDDVLEEAGEEMREIRRTRELAPLELLTRMSSARKFIRRVRVMAEDGRTGLFYYEFKGNGSVGKLGRSKKRPDAYAQSGSTEGVYA